MSIFEFNRVYLNMGKDFTLERQLDFEKLLKSYAEAKKVDQNQKRLVGSDGSFCRGRTIGCLAYESNKFIKGLGVISSEQDMASFTSKRQIRLLGQALCGKSKRISGYSMILLHCIFIELRESAHPNLELLKDCATVIYNLVAMFYEYYPDEIARFLLKCYSEVHEELEDPCQCKSLSDFPDIPKYHVNDNME